MSLLGQLYQQAPPTFVDKSQSHLQERRHHPYKIGGTLIAVRESSSSNAHNAFGQVVFSPISCPQRRANQQIDIVLESAAA